MLFKRQKPRGRLRVAIVHYHLKRGGVTRVIESALAAFDTLETPPEIVVLAGEIPEDLSFKERCRAIKGLRYSNAQERTPDPKSLRKALKKAAKSALGGDPDIWHIHNHSLGKTVRSQAWWSSSLRKVKACSCKCMILLKTADLRIFSSTRSTTRCSTRRAHGSITPASMGGTTPTSHVKTSTIRSFT